MTPHIGLDDGWVARALVEAALGDLDAVVERDHPVRAVLRAPACVRVTMAGCCW